jgi:FlaA1/EpsC-like NDP-sugar epimerase
MPWGTRHLWRGRQPAREGTLGDPDTGDGRSRSWRFRRFVLLVWDSVAWVLALVGGSLLRYEFELSQVDLLGLQRIIAVAILAQLVIGVALQVYRGRHCVGTMDDALNVCAAAGLAGACVFAFNAAVGSPLVPRSVPLIATLIALAIAVGARLVVRRCRERAARADRGSAQRVIVFGAGREGQQLIKSMLSDPDCGYLPVALLDDNPDLRRRRVSGVGVLGTRSDIAAVVAATGADMLVVAHRAADRELLREISAVAMEAGLGVKVLPPLAELLRPGVGIADLRDLDVADLLGRRPVEIDIAAIASYLADRRVLVTGAGGSIGSELCRQIHRFRPAELLMLDRDESALHGTQLSIYGTALLDSPDIILADIRDAGAIAQLFRQHRPDVVFHAAALKHLPLLEQYPEEAWKTNVIGTMNVLEAARRARVERFVNISTDKAANPSSVLGRSKRLGEMIISHVAAESAGTLLSVRFGNVLGSRGSVLTTFAEQLAGGSAITVTHPDVTRFFMTIPEAVQLVIYAAAIGARGQVLVLDMGAPVRIADVARQLMRIAGRSAQIVYTGLREGEKLHEEVFGSGEIDRRPIHPSISHVDVPGLDPADVVRRAAAVGVAEAMLDLAPGVADAEAPVRSAVGDGADRVWRQPA